MLLLMPMHCRYVTCLLISCRHDVVAAADTPMPPYARYFTSLPLRLRYGLPYAAIILMPRYADVYYYYI